VDPELFLFSRALVNMHLRFDGKLGFPGGLVEDGEDIETGKYPKPCR
jgi:8-oxo-dGTP pyrophosphatase MutT (NUDIX family)